MRFSAAFQLGSGRVLQGPGAIEQTGREARPYGNKALILASKTPWEKYGEKLIKSLSDSDIEYTFYLFEGYCSDNNTDQIAQAIDREDASLVIAMGGGRCLDTGKWAANKAGVRCVTVPTSAATCAGYVSLCVLYDDTGTTLKTVFCHHEVAAMLLDTDIIIGDCPARMFASGIADALAKFPEMDFSLHNVSGWDPGVMPFLGLAISDFNKNVYLQKGLQALADVRNGRTTDTAEDVLTVNIVTTGLISCMANNGKQIAVAHSIYDCVCALFKPQRAKYLHGEIVSCGLAVQMGINGYSEDRIDAMLSYLKELGTPTCLRDIEIEPTDENFAKISDYIIRSMDITDEDVRRRVNENLLRIR